MTIDHRQLALDHAEVAEESTSLFVMQKETRLAQIHATLAVAEQARIANLITAVVARTMSSDYVIGTFNEADNVSAAIREGLGI